MATKTTSKKTSSRKTSTAKKATKSAKTTQSQSSAKSAAAPVLKRAKSVGWLAILESLIVGALGVLLIINPSGISQIIFYIVGIFLMVKGVYHIVNYFAVHGKYDFYNNDLLYGIVALVFGILAVVFWEKLQGAIGIVVGAWMIYGALVRMNTAIKLHAAGVKEWFYILLLSLVMLALGIYMIVSFGTAALVIIGWVMVAAAVVGIVDDALFIHNVDAIEDL